MPDPSAVPAPIVVVGGGITGLSAAWQLGQLGQHTVLVEAAPRLGGKLRTTPLGPYLVDEAADAFLARVPWALELCDELGLTDALVHPAARSALIWGEGGEAGEPQLHPLPSPNVLGIPLDPDSITGDGLLSAAAADDLRIDLARTQPDAVRPDDTIGSLVRRRLGDEVHNKLVSSLLGSINAGDTDRLSVHASAPQIAAAARKHPSLLQGLLNARAGADPDAPVFAAHRDGMQPLVDALTNQCGADLRTSSAVESITPSDNGPVVTLADGTQLQSAACIVTTPSHVASGQLAVWAAAARPLAAIPHVSVVLVSLVFGPGDVSPPDGTSGFLVPHRASDVTITACSFTTTKWAHLDTEDNVVLRVSLGHRGSEAPINWTDEEVLAVVARDLATTLGIEAEPRHTRVTRWRDSFPQYEAGHGEQVDQVRQELADDGVFLAGMSYDGIGIPACINGGRAAARLAHAYASRTPYPQTEPETETPG